MEQVKSAIPLVFNLYAVFLALVTIYVPGDEMLIFVWKIWQFNNENFVHCVDSRFM